MYESVGPRIASSHPSLQRELREVLDEQVDMAICACPKGSFNCLNQLPTLMYTNTSTKISTKPKIPRALHPGAEEIYE